MNRRSIAVAATFIVAGVVTAITYGFDSQSESKIQQLAPFEFHREGAASPEDAAKVLFRGVATGSPKHFVQHLLLGVCDGPIATLNKFAESCHVTEFSHGDERFTFYDMREARNGINHKKPVRVIKTVPFDPEDKQVAALQFEMVSTYYGKAFMSVDVAAEGYDGREYQTRVVVALVGKQWFAMPRCRSAKSFYAIADAMDAPSHATNQVM